MLHQPGFATLPILSRTSLIHPANEEMSQSVVYVDFGGQSLSYPDLGVVRLRQCIGIGNLLATWGESILFAKEFDLPIVWPTWPQLSRQSIVSGRRYKNLFENDGSYIDGFDKMRYVWQWWRGTGDVASLGPKIPYHPNWAYGHDPISNHETIRAALSAILPDPTRRTIGRVAPNEPFIAVHVRRGDFSVASHHFLDDFGKNVNTPISIPWFIDTIRIAREATGCERAVVFSDGTDEELEDLASMDGVSIQREEAIVDLLVASQAVGFIASGSTFSMWISYLGQMPTWVHPQFTWFDGLHLDPDSLHLVGSDRSSRAQTLRKSSWPVPPRPITHAHLSSPPRARRSSAGWSSTRMHPSGTTPAATGS